MTNEVRSSRRDFLQHFLAMGGCFAATASLDVGELIAATPRTQSIYAFPQGVASADPQADAIMF